MFTLGEFARISTDRAGRCVLKKFRVACADRYEADLSAHRWQFFGGAYGSRSSSSY